MIFFKKRLLRNFGEKAQGSWYRWSNHFICVFVKVN